MLACDGSTCKHSPLGNNNRQGDVGTSQTSDSVVNNQSLPTGCCCRLAGALVGAAPIGPCCRGIACQSCGIVSVVLHYWIPKVEHSSSTRVDVKFAPLSLSNLAGAPKTAMKCS